MNMNINNLTNKYVGVTMELSELDNIYLVPTKNDTNGGVGCYSIENIIDANGKTGSFCYTIDENDTLLVSFNVVVLGSDIFNTTITITSIAII